MKKRLVGLLLSRALATPSKYEAFVNTKTYDNAENACRVCLITEAGISRLLPSSSTISNSSTETRYWTYESLATLHNLRNHCENNYCEISIEAIYGLSSPPSSDTLSNSMLKTMTSKIIQSPRICFVYNGVGLCQQCLARAVPDWKMMYRNAFATSNGTDFLLVFFAAKLPEPEILDACQNKFCRRKLGLVKPELCDEISRLPQQSKSIENLSVDQNTNEQHGQTVALKRQKLLQGTYLVDILNAHDSPLNMQCLRVRPKKGRAFHCSKCIAKAIGGFTIIYRDFTGSEVYMLLYYPSSIDNMLAVLKKNCRKKNSCTLITIAQEVICHNLSENLYEFPISGHSLQKDRICFGADFVHTTKSTCVKRLEKIADCFLIGDKRALCLLKLSNASDYEEELHLLYGKSELFSKCLITVYDDSVCDWHRKHRIPNLNSDYTPVIDLDSLAPSDLWPPCPNAPADADKKPLHRRYAPVLFSDSTSHSECLKCIATKFEVYNLSPYEDYVWMTQTTKSVVAECIKAGCAFVIEKAICTKNLPSSHPLAIDISPKRGAGRKRNREESDQTE